MEIAYNLTIDIVQEAEATQDVIEVDISDWDYQ
jgi:hypothetical protein